MSDHFLFDAWGSERLYIDGKLVWWRYPFEFPPSLMSLVIAALAETRGQPPFDVYSHEFARYNL